MIRACFSNIHDTVFPSCRGEKGRDIYMRYIFSFLKKKQRSISLDGEDTLDY